MNGDETLPSFYHLGLKGPTVDTKIAGTFDGIRCSFSYRVMIEFLASA